MIYFKIKGNEIVQSDTSDIIVQNSYRANEIFVVIEDLDLSTIECRITFGHDGKVVPQLSDLATYRKTINDEDGYVYNFSSRKVTEQTGQLDVAIKLIDTSGNDKVVSLVNSILYVQASVNQSSVTPTISEAQYNALSGSIAQTNNDLQSEITRAKDAEKTLEEKIEENSSALDNKIQEEEDRAIGEEKKLEKSINSNSKAIETETSRATQKESDLSVAIEAEKERALKAETNIREIAQGKTTSYPFNTKAEMDEWLSHEENTSKLNIGDEFYIIAPDEPDYWWDGTQAQPESNKIDLSGYATIDYVNEHINLALESDY